MDSDERLFERVRQGDAAAFETLYERYEVRLYHFLLRYLGDGPEAEDLFHESFMGVLRSRGVVSSSGSFRAWLYRIARNLCLNRLRQRERAGRALDGARLLERRGVGLLCAPPANVEERLASHETARALEEAVGALSTPLAEVYGLRVAGLSYEEMAQVLELPLGTVKSRMHEMVSQLKKEMKPWTAS